MRDVLRVSTESLSINPFESRLSLGDRTNSKSKSSTRSQWTENVLIPLQTRFREVCNDSVAIQNDSKISGGGCMYATVDLTKIFSVTLTHRSSDGV